MKERMETIGVTPAEQAALHKANALLGHWMGGINPCKCWRCQDIAQAIEQAKIDGALEEAAKHADCCVDREERDRAIAQPRPSTGGAAMTPAEQALRVEIEGDRLVISIGVATLAFAVTHRPGAEETMRITNPPLAAKEILRELHREEEDGTTLVHSLLDRAAVNAWENGGEGFIHE